MLRRFKLFGWLWVAFWWPYEKLNPHRGRSHTLRGTVERFLYLFWLPIAVTLLWMPEAALLWMLVLTGQGLQDMDHLRMDRMLFWQR